MKRKLLLFIIFLCTFFVQQNLRAQATVLAPGDIAFIGYQTGTPTDGFSFITLKDINAGTLVYFTEDGWGNGAWISSNPETHLLWTVPAFTPAGKIISVVETSPDNFTVTGSSGVALALNTGFNLFAGDQILAYQSSTGAEPASPTFIAGIHGDYNSSIYDPVTTWDSASAAATFGGAESSLPPGLTNGVNCISLFPAPGPELANSKYIGTLTGTVASLLAKINNPSATYWSHSTGATDLGITPVGFPTPAVSTVTVATVTTTTATSVKAVSAVIGGNVTADGGDSSVQKGIVWATATAPTTSDHKVPNGTGTGAFSATITGFPSGTTIYYRAYAANSAGTSYGTELTLVTGTGLSTSSTPQINVKCNGGATGSATVNVTGGTTPYTYSWSPSGGTGATASLLTAGSYVVTIIDGESTQITRNFTITEPAVLNGTPSTTPVSCFGGSNGTATIVPSGGSLSYTYLWSNGATTATASGLLAGTYNVTITDSNLCTKTVSNITVGGPSAALSGTSSTTAVSCFGGSNGTATAIPSGGTSGYTYSWAPTGGTAATATGLTAGTYNVTITDANSCTYTINNIVVGQPASALSGTSSTTPVSCFGGSNGTATVVASGGTSGYTYSWAPTGGTAATASGLTAGTYNVTITDANSCTYTVNNIVVGQPAAALNGTSSTTPVSCFGGSNGTATVVASGGTSGYTYSWAPSGGTAATATGLTAGTYNVTITDANSCSKTINSIVVGGPAAALSATSSTTPVSCFGGANGTATVVASGGTSGYTYSWAPSGGTAATATGLTAGTYNVTITDANSCTKTVSNITVGGPSAALSGTSSTTAVSCFGGSNGTATAIPSGGTSGYTYSWAPTGGTAATATGLTAGTYNVTITDANSCTHTVSNIVVGQPASALSGTSSTTPVSCFGGSNGTATVVASGGTSGYTYSWAPTGGTAATASGLTAGTYNVTITDANSCSKTINSIVVGGPAAALSATSSTTPVSCFGGTNGTATIVASGGTSGYTYSWAPTGGTAATASGLTAGTYNVTITDANSCTKTVSNITVGGPSAALSATSSTTPVSCFGGSNGTATVVASGGTSGYTYSWAPTGGTAATATGLTAGTYNVTITDANSCTKTVSNITVGGPSAALSATSSTTPVSCFGGSNGTATAIPSGGTSGYTYSWAPTGGTAATATGLTAGTYNVTITDANSCNHTVSNIVVGQPASALSGTSSTTPVSCFGGSNGTATAIPSGGTSGYTYSWAPTGGTAATASGLTAGTYNVTITDANSCAYTVNNIVVGQPAAALSGTSSTTPVSCFGGSNGTATVVASGGTSGYTYSWAPSGGTAATATGLTAGTYNVTITDANSCTHTVNNIVVGQPTSIVANPSQINVSCNGGSNGSATIAPSGGTGPYTYLWSNSGTTATASNLTQGNYSVTITDNNLCQITQNFSITEPTPLVATQDTFTDVSCNGGSNGTATVAVSGGSLPYSYSWSPSGGTGATASGLTQGTYTVTVTDNHSCTTTQSFTITEPSVFSVATSHNDVLCNGAASGSATVTVTGATAPYTYSWSPSGGTGATASGLTAGAYTVTITDSKSCLTTRNFMIMQPSALVASPGASSNINCYGDASGSATVNIMGGTPPYTYSWSPSGGTAATATGLTAGTYTVTIEDANSCQTTQSFTITQPAAILSATTASTGVSCFGGANGTATVNVSGGTPSYTYSWSPSGGTAATASGLSAGNYVCTITDSKGCILTENITVGTPTLLSATTAKTDVSCNGGTNGSVTATVTGGTGAYSYVWSPSGGSAATATGLSAGTYTVTITDANSCTTTQTATIAEPALLAVTSSKTDVLCNGGTSGTATVTASGGTGPYTYSWSPSGGTAATATGLSAGNYTCVVTDANGCTFTQFFTIGQPTILASSITKINATCLIGGESTVTASGGTTPYTYSWSPSGGTAATATGLSAGNYTVTVTDANGCTTTQNTVINTTNTLVAATSQTDVLCNGANTGSATVTPSGAPGPFTYIWAPSGGTAATANNLTAGNYSVTITSANGCSIVKNFTITEPTPLVATPSQTNLLCNGGTNGSASVVVTGGTGAYTYAWSPSGGTAATATGLTSGTYTVTIKDANLCQITQSFTITQPNALTATTTITDVSCNGGSNGSATVTATGGTGVYTYVWSPTGGTAATATGLSAGTYTVTITDANSCTTTQNVTINEPLILAATTTQTNVTCIGATDGSATVTATGGTAPYTYTWSPTGGTAATATGLTAGNYTVTITDANGCQLTKPVTILTIPDVTAPVPNLANLPVITSNCSILSAQIPVPTATDNCTGIINATTTNPLSYTAVGSYVITWSYNDGHGNISTQNQTLNVTASPLDLVTFSNAQFTYNGSLKTVQVANLPAGATVAYTITPTTGTANGATNAGVYSITAIITPSASTPNCSPITLTAQLTIKKAAQQITFGAIPVKILGANNSFNLNATSDSGLAVTYSFLSSTSLPAATVSATTGLVTLLRPGQIVITAHQSGDNNYLPATDVSQVLIVKNNDISIASITIGNHVYQTPSQTPSKDIKYLMACGENNPNVSILNVTNATIVPSANFSINTPKPGIYTQNVSITSEDGSTTANYTITVEKPFNFFDIVHQKFNNVLLVNDNPQTNGGYEFVSYEWFKNGQSIGTGQYYSAGNALGNTLDPTADYSVKMTTKDGKVLQTCNSKISLLKSVEAKLYPNPIQTGKTITVEADFPSEELANMQISLYSVSGELIKTVKSSTIQTEIQLPQAETSMYIVVIETANIKKTLKVIVNK